MRTATIQYRCSVLIDEGYTTAHEIEMYMPEPEMFVAWLANKWQERAKKSALDIGAQIAAQDAAFATLRPKLVQAVKQAGGWGAIEAKYGERVNKYLKKYEIKKPKQ